MSRRHTKAVLAFAMVTTLIAPPAAQACSHPEFRDFKPGNNSCSLSRVKTQYTPNQEGYCAGDINIYQCCDTTTIAKKKRETQWTDPGCGGPMVGDTGWVADGNTTNATARSCF